MRQHSIVLLPGDGIGPEITAVARSLLKAVAAKYKFGLHFDEQAMHALFLYPGMSASWIIPGCLLNLDSPKMVPRDVLDRVWSQLQ